jgi:hypothetical protein
MALIAIGQISITDQNDSPPVTSIIQPSISTHQFYDPNATPAYLPDYTDTPLVLTAKVYMGTLTESANVLTARKWSINSPDATSIGSNTTLTINTNQTFGNAPVIYYFQGVYNDPQTNFEVYVVASIQLSISKLGADGSPGAPGSPGSPGAPGLTSSISLNNFTVLCDSGGIPLENAFDLATGVFKVWSGTTEVTDDTTFTFSLSGVTGHINNSTNQYFTGSKGAYRITGLSADAGYINLIGTYNTIPLTHRFSVQKQKEAKAGGVTQASTYHPSPSWPQITSLSYGSTTAGTLTLSVGPGGNISVSVGAYYLVPATVGSVGTITGKIQYKSSSSGTWIDFPGASGEGSEAYYNLTDLFNEQGSFFIFSTSMAGPAVADDYDFRFVARLTNSGDDIVTWVNGAGFLVSWSP